MKSKKSNKSGKLLKNYQFKPMHAILAILFVAVVGGFLVYSTNAASEPPGCARGTRSLGYNIGFKNGKGYKIRLCRIEGFKSKGSEDGGYVRVSSNASARWLGLYKAAKSAGFNLVANSSFRSHSKQTELYNCYKAGKCNQAAPPGYSNHQSGEAIDIDIVPGANNDPSLRQCLSNPKKYPLYNWLSKNAYKYYRYARIADECWHWSPTGY